MSDSLLDKYINQKADRAKKVEAEDETETTDDLGSFGWLRGIRDRALMLQLRKKNGNIEAPSYGLLERAEFDPSEGITLHFVGQTIRIRGRNLNKELRPSIRLFEGITRHRVPWIQEADETTVLAASKQQTVVESID